LSPPLRAPADRTLCWALFCALLGVYLATFAGLPENPDAEVEFQTASALVRKGSFALGGTPEADCIVSIVHEGRPGFNVRRGKPGREHESFSWSGVGQALVAVPFHAAGSLCARLWPELEERHRATTRLGVGQSEYTAHLFVGLRNPLLGALTGALLFLVARRMGASRRSALLSAFGYGLCSYAWPQAHGTLSDVQATAMLLLAFVCAQGALRRLRAGEATCALELVGFGLALGLAFLTRLVMATGVAVLGLYFTLGVVTTVTGPFRLRALRWRALRAFRWGTLPWRALTLGLAPALACFGVFLWTNWLRFGDPLESGYGGVVGSDWFARAPWEGLVGVTVSPGSGLLWFAPGLLAGVPWCVSAWRRGERELPLLLLALLVVVGVPHVLIPSWTGAQCYGPRYLLPLVAFLWLPLGPALDLLWANVAARTLALGLLALGFVTALGGVLVEYPTNLDLTAQAARLAWPPRENVPETVQDDERFRQAKFDWRFAAPWAHWRILSHRLDSGDERFSVRELYFLDDEATLTPQHERYRGFAHLAWVDLHERLAGPAWPGPLVCLGLLAASAVLFRRGARAPAT